MKADGSVLINTKIDDSGMEKGFRRLVDGMDSVSDQAREMGRDIANAFSGTNVASAVDAIRAQIQSLEEQMESVTSERKVALAEGDDKGVASLERRMTSLYDRLEKARQRLAREVEKEASRQARAEEKAAERAIKAAEKEAKEKERLAKKQADIAMRPVKRFKSRISEIVTGALFFNIISAGIREMTQYFGEALKTNNQYTNSVAKLKGALLTAFQPIYEYVVPAIIYMINFMTAAIEVVGRFFAVLAGKEYSQMKKNAEAMYNEAKGIKAVGDSAEKAKKQLMGFDEINKLTDFNNVSTSSTKGDEIKPEFEDIDIPDNWEKKIESLAMRIKDIFFEWEDLTPEIIAEKLIAALTTLAGGFIGFALGGPGGAILGMTLGAGLGVVLSNVIFNGDGKLDAEEVAKSLVAALSVLGGAIIGFAVGGPAGAAIGIALGAGLGVKIVDLIFNGDGKLTGKEIVKALVGTLSVLAGTIIGFAVGGPAGAAIGATVGLALAFTIQHSVFDGIGNTVKQMLANIKNYFVETFSNGFINGLVALVTDAVSFLWNLFTNFLSEVVRNWNQIWGNLNHYQTTGTLSTEYYIEPSNARSMAYPEIPMLARGAVIPPNAPFMAVLGDQKHGTNIEAPADLIRKIIREELGNGANSDETAALLRELIQVVLGIHIGDETIGKAAARYNRRTSRAGGY